MAFQVLEDGISEVAIFGMFTEEYGPGAHGPNRGYVHISVLEGLPFLQPPNIVSAAKPGVKLQTVVYRSLIHSYLDFAKAQGMTTAFLFSRPPGVSAFWAASFDSLVLSISYSGSVLRVQALPQGLCRGI